MSYYCKKDGKVELTWVGQSILKQLGLELSDIKNMSKKQLINYVNKFKKFDPLDDGIERKGDKREFKEAGKKESQIFEGIYAKNTPNYSDSGSFSRYFDLDLWWREKLKYLPPEIQKTFPAMIVPKAKRRGGIIDHPTKKPLKLMSYLVTLGSREGDIILDPYIGSGTTAVAAKILKRKFIGSDIKKKYIQMALNRLKKVKESFDITKLLE